MDAITTYSRPCFLLTRKRSVGGNKLTFATPRIPMMIIEPYSKIMHL